MTTPDRRGPELRPEAGSTSAEGANATMDVLITYRREELAWYQRRLDSTNTQAAGTITLAVAFGGVAATALAAAGRHLSALSIIMISLGAAAIIVGAIRAFSVLDTSHQPARWSRSCGIVDRFEVLSISP